MSNLLASLTTAGSALDIYQQALDNVQNNITNASTPGYAKQTINLTARSFDLAGGLAGGVAAMGLSSARDQFAEEAVRRQEQALGQYEAQAQGTNSIQSLFDVTGNSGIAADLTALFQSFSAWSVNPTSTAARQSVIASGSKLASDVQRLSSSLAQTSSNIQNQIGSTVDQINQLTAQIAKDNLERLKATAPDPGQDANLNAALEQLSGLVDVHTVNQPDGTVTVLLSGGAPLVLGQQQFDVSSALGVPSGAVNPQGPPSSQILDSQGHDITSQIQGGKLGGLLDVHNRVLASMFGDGGQPGSLNTFAKEFADTVNGILQSGTVSTAPGAAQGLPMFVYDNTSPTASAGSFALNPALTADTLAPADTQGNANGNAIQLASLANSPTSGGINGQTFGDFFSGIASAVGNETATAQSNQIAQQQVVAQTRSLRDQSSGVSLDEQAVMLLEFQKNYQATARLLTTLNTIVDTTLNLIPQ